MNNIRIIVLVFSFITLSCSGSRPEPPVTLESDSGTSYTGISIIYRSACMGCEGLSLFGGFLQSNVSGIEVFTCMSDDFLELQISSRIEQAARVLDLDTCAIMDSSIVGSVVGEECLDAGIISISAEWDGWLGLEMRYSDITRNYPSDFLLGDSLSGYKPGMSIDIDVEGSSDIGGFISTVFSVNPIYLLSPITDLVRVDSIPADQSLVVEWTGGEMHSVVIYIVSEWVTYVNRYNVVACHAINDGLFTIPVNIVSQFDWGQVAELEIVETSFQGPLSNVSSLKYAALLGSSSSSYIHYDVDAVPSYPEPDGQMKEGFVGLQCNKDQECGGGKCINIINSTPINLCTLPYCQGPDDCPSDSYCFSAEQASLLLFSYPTFCTKKCDSDDDCNKNDYDIERCYDQNGNKSCVIAAF